MYQYTVIVGNVGRDPEMRYTQSGSAVCDFSVAVNRRWNNKDGEPQEKTTWFRVSAWNKLAETCNQFVVKGMRILVAGEVDASAWIGQDGDARATLELNARDVKFLGGGDSDRSASADAGTDPEMNDIPF